MKDFYEEYWITRDTTKSDQRTIQRAKLISRLITKTSGSLLDVGCGKGIISEFFYKKGFDVKAVDISSEAVKFTKERGIDAMVCDIEKEEIKGKYDVILCIEVLEHLIDPLGVLKKLKGSLKEDGEIIISLPNEFHIIRRLQILFGKQDFSKYDWHHLRFFDKKEANRLITDAGLCIKSVVYLPLMPPRMFGANSLGIFLAKLYPSLFSFSFIFRAVKGDI